MEKKLIAERTKAGLQARRAKGLKLGRPKGSGNKQSKLFRHLKEIDDRYHDGVPIYRLSKDYNVSWRTLNNFLVTYKSKKQQSKRTATNLS